MNTVMILAKDIMASVIEDDVDIMTWLRDQAQDNELVVLLSCVIEGLERARYPTSKGLRALGELISISRFQPMQEQTGTTSEEGTTIRLTADVLLSCLLGRIDSSIIAQVTQKFPVVINDALLVGALLSVADEDDIHPNNLAAVLKLTTMHLIDPAETDRVSWPEELTAETISWLRAKALVHR